MTDPAPSDRTALALGGLAVLAVVCCAGGPLFVAVAGSLAIGTVVGIGAAACLLVVACALLYVRHRSGSRRPWSRP